MEDRVPTRHIFLRQKPSFVYPLFYVPLDLIQTVLNLPLVVLFISKMLNINVGTTGPGPDEIFY